jgi:hypothetical protein
MRNIILCLAPLLTLGCLGEGGDAYDGGVKGTEQGYNQPESGFGGVDDSSGGDQGLFATCMQVCSEEASAEYCREEVCAEFQSGGGPSPQPLPDPDPEPDEQPSGGPVDNCVATSQAELDGYDALGVNCRSCICDTAGNDLTTCATECSGL